METEDKAKIIEQLFIERDNLIIKANKLAKRKPKRTDAVLRNMQNIVNLTVDAALIQKRIHLIISQPSVKHANAQI